MRYRYCHCAGKYDYAIAQLVSGLKVLKGRPVLMRWVPTRHQRTML